MEQAKLLSVCSVVGGGRGEGGSVWASWFAICLLFGDTNTSQVAWK